MIVDIDFLAVNNKRVFFWKKINRNIFSAVKGDHKCRGESRRIAADFFPCH
jgi:hypothetical protein